MKKMLRTGIIRKCRNSRRNVEQGGVKIDGEKALDIALILNKDNFKDGQLLLQRGKKVFHRVQI